MQMNIYIKMAKIIYGDIKMMFLKAFIVGGLICVIGQLLIDLTKLTPAKILVLFVCIGVLLGGLGIYQHLIDFAGAGATSFANRFWCFTCKRCKGSHTKRRFYGCSGRRTSSVCSRNYRCNAQRSYSSTYLPT